MKPFSADAETETENEEVEIKANADICQQLMDRYASSAAPQHRHLVATAAAMRSILTSESFPLTPSAYFAAAISSLESATLDSTEISALLTFLSLVVAVVHYKEISESKASEAVGVLVGLLERGGLGMASVRSVVKCLGVLFVGFCDLEDWNSVELGFQTLLKFSVDKRPKVRRCAQDCLQNVFKAFQSSTVIKAASILIHSLFTECLPLATTLSTSRTVDGPKDETLMTSEHLEVLHVLNVVKLTVPYLSVKVSSKILSELSKLTSSEFSPITRHILKNIEAFYGSTKVEVVIPETENIVVSLASYVLLREKNPMDTIMSAVTLLKIAMDKLYIGEIRSTWIKNVPIVCGSLVGLLTYEDSTASQATVVMKELISQFADKKTLLIDENLSFQDGSQKSEEVTAVKSTCVIFESILDSYSGIPNEHILEIISLLFLKLGEVSYIFMKSILLKLADLMTLACDMSQKNHLQRCIGSAVIAMGPERILTLLPISFHDDDFTCSNIWLIPILKNHVVEASLGYYMEHIVPLAKSFQRACRKVKKSDIGKDLQAHAHGLWGLLPAFCRYPNDTCQNCEPLAKLLITLLKKDSFMHENIAVALQVLVNQNRSVLISKKNLDESNMDEVKNSVSENGTVPPYSKKTATKNIRAFASCSAGLLQALTNLFIDSPREKYTYLKDAIGSVASITDSSITKNIFTSLLKRFQLVNDAGEFEKPGIDIDNLIDKQPDNQSTLEKELQRCVIIDLASSLVEGASEDLVDFIYNFIRHTFQTSDEIGHHEAYHTLRKILKEHDWFCTSRFEEVIDLLFTLKAPAAIEILRSRFACFHFLMVYTLKLSSEEEEENTKAFLILNEIILTLKDAKEETRKAAYDILLSICSSLVDSSYVGSDAPYHKLISMILGYLSGSSPHIKSGAVSALSVLVHKDPDICLSMPGLVSSVISLLQSKALEVIKAVLGFVKVMVSCLQAKDIQDLRADVISEVLPWSSVSRNHFRSKVTVILEIMMRKCGFAAVESVTPEKYRRFVKTVLEDRQNKTRPKEGSTDVETLTENSPNEGPHNKRKEMHTLPNENGSTEHRKRNREEKHDSRSRDTRAGGFKPVKRARHFNHEKSMEGESQGSGRKNTGIFNKGPPGGGNRRTEQNKMGRGGGKRGVRRPASASKFSKHKKFGNK
ncbi:hypothetical protein LWI29_036449 [Acer saccharum]|uniref:Ribosomal RNA-processing protein 12-like conserved domain-containing protein n=1 Tax=Acer saccharum TaxID=4024 RepID=A0AA39SV93_ACESA|nr:hypothetical protein LWI29_036449 [Acer saccharum]